MRLTWFKHLFVFVCLFSLLESTGISMIKLIAKAGISQTDKNSLADDDATERSEREVSVKEMLAIEPFCTLPLISLQAQSYIYPTETLVPHLGWISPVPTPPPDCRV